MDARMNATTGSANRCERPLVMRCGAFGDMVLLTTLIRRLHARFGLPVDIVASGPWTEPLLNGQPGVGEIFLLRSRKTPYWFDRTQQRVVHALRARGAGPTWFCDAYGTGRELLTRARIPEDFVVDVRRCPGVPGQHFVEYWLYIGSVMPAAFADRPAVGAISDEPGCALEISDAQRSELHRWLDRGGLGGRPLLLVQAGSKRTMRGGRRKRRSNTKFWPEERWAQVIRAMREDCPQHAIVLTGVSRERGFNEEIARLASAADVFNVAGDLTVPRLVALLAHAEALISVDSGPAHAAAAVGCPQVVLFGQADPALYRPWGLSKPHVICLTGEVAGTPAILGIEAHTVIEAWRRLPRRKQP
jgi:heptosyltransferase-2/heptosyltransferase-3